MTFKQFEKKLEEKVHALTEIANSVYEGDPNHYADRLLNEEREERFYHRKAAAIAYLNELQYLDFSETALIKLVNYQTLMGIVETAEYSNNDVGRFTGVSRVNGKYYVWLAPLSDLAFL